MHNTPLHSPRGQQIVPARAGFTVSKSVTQVWHWDHPRSRGVYMMSRYVLSNGTGSSPLARGFRLTRKKHTEAFRIIPARAGFTKDARGLSPSHRDHPRSRGVYLFTEPIIEEIPGSSPLARGLPGCPPRASLCVGIIPARAGFTRACAPGLALRPDHPRSRGVYIAALVAGLAWFGSSPLARGLHGGDCASASVLGIIPARAGFTDATNKFKNTLKDHPRSRGVYGPPCLTRRP